MTEREVSFDSTGMKVKIGAWEGEFNNYLDRLTMINKDSQNRIDMNSPTTEELDRLFTKMEKEQNGVPVKLKKYEVTFNYSATRVIEAENEAEAYEKMEEICAWPQDVIQYDGHDIQEIEP